MNLEPTYLRYIYDGLVKGSIHPENAAELPDGLIGMYEEAFDERTSVIERQKLLQRFAIWALLKKEVSAAFVAEVLGETEDDIQEFISTYSAWFNSPESGKYQLYHERLKVYLLQKLSEGEIHTLHEKLLARLEKAIEAQKADEFEWYGLEFLTSHLSIAAMLNGDGKKLIDLAYSQTHWQRQLKISKGYSWTKNSIQEVMAWASKYNDDEVIECGLQMVDLHHQEQNAAPQIVALVAEGEFDAALKRIEQFGGSDKEGLKRKFILYMLCLMELTLLDSNDKPNRKVGIEKLLKHMDEQLPVDHSVLNWAEFFPSNLMFTILIEFEKNNLKYNQILSKTSVFESEWMELKRIFCNDEIHVLKILSDYYQNRGIENIVLFNEKLEESAPVLFSSSNLKMDKYWFSNLLVFNAKYLFENNYSQEANTELIESLRITQTFQNRSNIFLSLKNIFYAALDCNFLEILESILFDFLNHANTIIDDLEREFKLLEYIELSIKAQGILLASEVLARIETPYYKSCGLLAITNFMLKDSNEDLIDRNLKELNFLIDQINNEFEKGDVQKQYCILLLNYNGLSQAIIYADEIKGGGGFFRDDALGNLAVELIKKSMISSSIELLETKSLIFFIEGKVHAELSKYYFKNNQIDEAIRNLYLVIDDEEFEERSNLLRYLISALHDNKNDIKIIDLLVDFISQGSQELNEISYNQTRTDLFFELYKKKSPSFLFDIDHLLSDFDKAELFGKISIFHKKKGENNMFVRYLNLAISAYDLVESDFLRDYLYEKLIEHLIEEEEFDLAEKLIEKLRYAHTMVSSKYRLLCKLKSCYQVLNKKVEQTRIIKKQSSILKEIHPLEDILDIQLRFSQVNKKNQKEIEDLCDMALTIAFKTNDIEKRTSLISKVSTLLFKVSRFEESNAILKDLIEYTIKIKNEIKKSSALKNICLELLNQLKIDNAISVAMHIPILSDRNSILMKIGRCSVLNGTIEKAFVISNLINNQQIRQELWSTIEGERIDELSKKEIFKILDRLHDFDSKYHYFEGWVKNQKVITMDIEITRNTILRVKSNLSQMEPIINKYLLNQLFFNQIKNQHLQIIEKTPSLQWAIDIKNQLPN